MKVYSTVCFVCDFQYCTVCEKPKYCEFSTWVPKTFKVCKETVRNLINKRASYPGLCMHYVMGNGNGNAMVKVQNAGCVRNFVWHTRAQNARIFGP
jgi:hypothetical protein